MQKADRRISWGGRGGGRLLIRAKNLRFSWLKRIFMILIRANTESQIPVLRATLVSAPPSECLEKYVYGPNVGTFGPSVDLTYPPLCKLQYTSTGTNVMYASIVAHAT